MSEQASTRRVPPRPDGAGLAASDSVTFLSAPP
jgi:hypothetical protein